MYWLITDYLSARPPVPLSVRPSFGRLVGRFVGQLVIQLHVASYQLEEVDNGKLTTLANWHQSVSRPAAGRLVGWPTELLANVLKSL